MVALRLHQNDKNDPPVSPQSPLTDVTGIAGRLCHHDSPPANDITAALFILISALWWMCAINFTKLTINGPFFCKLTCRQFFPASTLYALLVVAYVLSAILRRQCQKNHLPT